MSALLVWAPQIRQAHVALVLVSGTLFALRGAGALAGARWPLHSALRVGSVAIDTLLLGAGVMLWVSLSLNPFRDDWLGAKLLLLVLYVVLGTWALKRARQTASRAAFYIAALTVFATMVSIAITHHPLGMWRWS